MSTESTVNANAVITEPPPKRTFMGLVAALASSEDSLADPDFDPAALVGDIKDKVDALHEIEKRMESVAAFLKALAKPVMTRSGALLNNRNRLRNYIVQAMQSESLERLPGNAFAVRLRDSNEALEMEREATPTDFTAWAGYVMVERAYRWDTEKIKEDLKGGILGGGFPGRLTRGQWPEFTPNVPEQLQKPKKKK